MIKYLKKNPLLTAAVCCVISGISAFYSAYSLLICLAVAIIILFFSVLYSKFKLLICAVLVVVAIFSGFLTLSRIANLNCLDSCKLNAQVVVIDTAYEGEEYYCSTVEVLNSDKIKKGTKISLWHTPQKVEMGDIYNTSFTAYEIEKENKASLYAQGIFLSATATSLETLYKKDAVLSQVARVRKYIRKTLFENTEYSAASTLCAIIMGERRYFSDEFYSNVKGAGVAHVMVVSGMHLSILISMWVKATRKYINKNKLIAILIFLTVVLLWSVCGFTVSLLRAGITYIIMAVGLWFNKPYSGVNALSATVILVTIFEPFTIFNIAFQLSVLATFGILAVALPVCNYISEREIVKGKLRLFITESFIISISAIILTLPVIIHVFGYLSLWAALSNLLIDHAVTGAIIISVIALVINLIFPFGAKILFIWSNLLIKFVNGIINFIGSQDYGVIRIPKEFTFVAVAVIIALFWILLTCKSRIDVLKLKEINQKIKNERGKAGKWR